MEEVRHMPRARPRRLPSRSTVAVVLGGLALFVALGGPSYATSLLDGHQIKKHSIPSDRLTEKALQKLGASEAYKVGTGTHLPAGSYVLVGGITFQNNGASPQLASCSINETGGSLEALATGATVPPRSGTTDGFASLPATGRVGFGSGGGTVSLQCSGPVPSPQVFAVKVAKVH
jgi:hypothetical protein